MAKHDFSRDRFCRSVFWKNDKIDCINSLSFPQLFPSGILNFGSLQIGPTAHCLIKLQFEMTKRGDRFFYTNPDQFTIKQLEEIKKQSLTSLLCVNSDEPTKMNLQPNVFRKLDSTTNALKSCSEYPNLDLSMWSGFEAPDAWDLPEPNLWCCRVWLLLPLS